MVVAREKAAVQIGWWVVQERARRLLFILMVNAGTPVDVGVKGTKVPGLCCHTQDITPLFPASLAYVHPHLGFSF